MRSKTFLFVLCFALLMVGSCSKNQEPVTTTTTSWADITVRAVGMGAPPTRAVNRAQAKLMACRAAKADALRQLKERVYGVRVDSRTHVRDFITQSDEIRIKTEGFISNAQVVSERTLDDGTCEVTIELYLGKLVEIIKQ